MSLREQHARLLKSEARKLGFEFVGISKAVRLDKEAQQLEAWLNQHYHGEMQYMANHFEKRIDPRQLVEGAKSVVSLLFNYHNPAVSDDPEAPKIAQYAYGEDYHFVIKDKLRMLLSALRVQIGDIGGRCFVDSAPVMERTWAARSGLGWQGKHTLLINKKRGSYFFLAELILDIELTPDSPIKDYCGTCTRCLDACPTGAIAQPYLVDASKCIAYLTIELKNAIPLDFAGKMENWAFGCDICQQVCPWNRFAKRHQEPRFEPHENLLQLKASEWHEITESVFQTLFKKSAIKRTKFAGLKRNIQFLARKNKP